MNVDPERYFKDYNFTESLVHRIVHDAERQQLEFVLAYMDYDKTLTRMFGDPRLREPYDYEEPWDFRRLLFCRVTQLSRTNVRYKKGFQGFDPGDFNFSEVKTPLTPSVEFARVNRTKQRKKAEIDIGSLGVYCFEFDNMLADQRLVKTIPVSGSKSDHIDYYTGVKVNYYDPFPMDYVVSICTG